LWYIGSSLEDGFIVFLIDLELFDGMGVEWVEELGEEGLLFLFFDRSVFGVLGVMGGLLVGVFVVEDFLVGGESHVWVILI
jgi:hypothetical protein